MIQLKFLLVFLLLTLLLPAVALAGETPKLNLLNPTVDFGTVEQGSPVEVAFLLRNDGDAPLEIGNIQPQCGCTAAMIDSSKVDPGKTATLKATLDTKDFTGKKTKTVRIATNDPAQRSAVLTLEGIITAEVELEPHAIYVPQLRRGETVTKTVTARVRAPVQILEVVSPTPQLRVSAVDVVPPGRGKTITVQLGPDLPIGLFTQRLSVKTTSERKPIVALPVVAVVQGTVSATPPEVSFGLVAAPLGEPLVRDVTVSVTGEREVNLLSVHTDNPVVQTQMKTIKKGHRYLVRISISAGTGETILKESVKIITDHPDPAQRELVIPVNGIFSTKQG